MYSSRSDILPGAAADLDKDLRVTPGLRPSREQAMDLLLQPGTMLLSQGVPSLSIGVWRSETLRRLHVITADIGPMINHQGLDFHKLRGDALKMNAFERVADKIQGVLPGLPLLPESSTATLVDGAVRHLTEFGWRRIEPELMPAWPLPILFRRGETLRISGRVQMLEGAVDRAPFLPLCRVAGLLGPSVIGVIDQAGQIGRAGLALVALSPADLAGLNFIVSDRQIVRATIERDPALDARVRQLTAGLPDTGAALPDLADAELCEQFDRRLARIVRLGGFSLRTQKAIEILRTKPLPRAA